MDYANGVPRDHNCAGHLGRRCCLRLGFPDFGIIALVAVHGDTTRVRIGMDTVGGQVFNGGHLSQLRRPRNAADYHRVLCVAGFDRPIRLSGHRLHLDCLRRLVDRLTSDGDDRRYRHRHDASMG